MYTTQCGSAVGARAAAVGAVAPGSPLTFAASSAGCAKPLYQFWVRYPSGTWYLKQKWSATATFSWNTTGLANGAYLVKVAANQQGGSLTALQAVSTSAVTAGTCKTDTLAPATGTVHAGS